jgi:hypothetical protein
MRLHDCVNLAVEHGYKVIRDDGDWYVTIPKTPRMSSQVLGPYRHERTAWMDAALLAQMK